MKITLNDVVTGEKLILDTMLITNCRIVETIVKVDDINYTPNYLGYFNATITHGDKTIVINLTWGQAHLVDKCCDLNMK